MNNLISTFKTFDSDPVNILLSRWVRSTRNPELKYSKKVQRYRETGQDKLKKTLPMATVGAVCEGGRRIENVTKRTGWIALDIDGKENPHLKNAEAMRDTIANIVYVAFAGLSVSGQGIWALVKVAHPERQDKYFEQLQIDFKSRGIILDSTKGKNPNDARFYSFDPNAYIADDFKIYDRLPKKKLRHKPQRFVPSRNSTYTRAKVERLISKINIDITAGYDNWIQLGFALEDEFGNSGLKYFHAISQYHPDYNRRECDWQYTQCLKHRGSGIGIATFFYKCKENGITLEVESEQLKKVYK